MKYRVKLHSAKCIGCVMCTRCCNFFMGTDGRAHLLNSRVNNLGCIAEVAETCPVDAILIEKIQ